MDTRKAVALLIYLAITRQGHRRDTLANLLWPENDQTHARATLRRTLSALNKALDGNWIQADRDTIALDPAMPIWIDSETFLQYIVECRMSTYPAAQIDPARIEALKQAVMLYQADFLAGFHFQGGANFERWQFFQADTLQREYAYALEQLVQYYIQRAEFDVAIDYAQRWLNLDRSHEPAYSALIHLYTWTGHRTTALQYYEECVRILRQEFGIQPTAETRQLYKAIKENQNVTLPIPISIYLEQHMFAEAGSSQSLLHSTSPTLDAATSTDTDPLIGRAEVWTQLLAAYAQAQFHGQVILLEGEAGIGKTRLSEEIMDYAQKQGASIIRVRCYENESNIAYSPIANGLQAVLTDYQNPNHPSQTSLSWLQEVMRLLPQFTATSVIPSATDRPEIQHRFYDAMSQFLISLSVRNQSTAPGIIFIDDMQWADAESVQLLTYFIHRYYGTSLCLLLTWRTPQPDKLQPFAHVLTQLFYEGLATWPTLQRLDASMVLQWVQKRLTSLSEQVHIELAERLYAETEGLPFFLAEYIMALKSGMLHPEDDVWQVPRKVRDMLIAQLRATGNIGRELLSAASIIGNAFDFDMLREISSHSEEDMVSALEQLISQGLIQEVPAALQEKNDEGMHCLLYTFNHGQLRRLVYEETSQARRCLFHRRTAEALIVRGAEQHAITTLAAQIAYHYQMAKSPSKAAEWNQRLAHQQ